MNTKFHTLSLAIALISYGGLIWFFSQEQLFHIAINIGILSIFTVIVAGVVILSIFYKKFSDKSLNYTLLISSIFLTLLGSEVGFRVKAYQEDLKREEALENLEQAQSYYKRLDNQVKLDLIKEKLIRLKGSS